MQFFAKKVVCQEMLQYLVESSLSQKFCRAGQKNLLQNEILRKWGKKIRKLKIGETVTDLGPKGGGGGEF
jgi:hypothetical protein